jgi:hypothetical protein
MNAREVVALALGARLRVNLLRWAPFVSHDHIDDLRNRLADDALAAMREHLAKAVPACGCTKYDCEIDATREAMLKALGDARPEQSKGGKRDE